MMIPLAPHALLHSTPRSILHPALHPIPQSTLHPLLHSVLPPVLIVLALICAALVPFVARLDPDLGRRVVRMDALPSVGWPRVLTRIGAASLLGSFAVLLADCYLILDVHALTPSQTLRQSDIHPSETSSETPSRP